MNKSIRQKLESTSDRFEEVSNLLADPEIIAQKKKFRDLSKEYARLNPIVSIFKEYQSLLSDIKTVDEMTKDNYDLDMVSFSKKVPGFFVDKLPNDISYIKDTETRKKVPIASAIYFI